MLQLGEIILLTVSTCNKDFMWCILPVMLQKSAYWENEKDFRERKYE